MYIAVFIGTMHMVSCMPQKYKIHMCLYIIIIMQFFECKHSTYHIATYIQTIIFVFRRVCSKYMYMYYIRIQHMLDIKNTQIAASCMVSLQVRNLLFILRDIAI